MAEQEYDIMKPMVGIMMIGIMAAIIIPMMTPPEPPEPPPPTYCCSVCEELGTPVCFYTYEELAAHFAAEHPTEPVEPVVIPDISIGDITWDSENGLVQFEIGSTQTAKVVMENPTTKPFNYTAFLYMGININPEAEADFHLDAGESKEISFTVTMPSTAGEYPVYIGVFSERGLIKPLQQCENIVLVEPGVSEFSMPAAMRRSVSPTIEPYTVCEVWVDVTNNGDKLGTQIVHIWDSAGNVDVYITVVLAPGETYTWNRIQWVDFSRISYSVWAQGDWVGDNYSEARFPS